jgi:aryl-alcohol dehydrogenase-like predicted oxidoreductase
MEELRQVRIAGLKVSEICLGTMTLAGQADEETSFEILDAALDAGIGFLDTADCYPIPLRLQTAGHSEDLIGRWIAKRGVRDRLVIASKAYFPVGQLPIQRGNSGKHLVEACEASLRRLRTDRIDLYLCHGWDDTVPIEETLEALERLRHQAAIVGASRPEQLADHVAATRSGMPTELEERLDRVWYDLPRRPPELDSPRIADLHALRVSLNIHVRLYAWEG